MSGMVSQMTTNQPFVQQLTKVNISESIKSPNYYFSERKTTGDRLDSPPNGPVIKSPPSAAYMRR